MSNRERPIEGDPGAESLQAMFDVHDGIETWLCYSGTFDTFAAETMTRDGGSYQKVVCVQLPVRKNYGQDVERVRIMLSPQVAAALVGDLLNALDYVT